MIAPALFESQIADLISYELPPESDLTGFRCGPAGLLIPKDRDGVIRIVRAAVQHRVRLHVVSCGRNWGFGSALPGKAGTWILSLSALQSITSYNAEIGSVWVEPGVTQIQLHRKLEEWGGDWFFNVTGAGHQTSVLGNALERGIGYHGQRHLDLVELEVLTGRGELVTSRVESCHSASLGLDLGQLFVQSSLGIVLSGRVRLIKRTNGGGAAIVRLGNPKRTADFFERILSLKKEGVINGVPHIANRMRILSTMAPWIPREERPMFERRIAPWTAALPLQGCREITDTAIRIIERRLGQFCDLETVIPPKEKTLGQEVGSPMEQLELLASGYPSNLALPGVEWTAFGKADLAQTNPESTGAGLIHVTPAVDSSYSEIQRCLSLVEATTQSIGLGSLPITINIVDQLTSILVVSLGFPASSSGRFRTKAGLLEKALKHAGIAPYRIGLSQKAWIPVATPAQAAIYRRLRHILDPHCIFEPSKYAAAYRRSATGRATRDKLCRSRSSGVENEDS